MTEPDPPRTVLPAGVRDLAARAERHQIPVHLAVLAVAVVVGSVAPGPAAGLDVAIEPVLALLLFATFRQVPFTALARALRGGRFLVALLVVNVVVAPLVVWALVPFVPGERAVLLGVLLVLLTPCVDYVIVFSGLAGGAADRLLAATPLLVLAQVLLLPVALLLLLGPDVAAVVDPGPFLHAFVMLVAVPLVAAVGVELLARRHRAGVLVTDVATVLMVPLLAATLFLVVASQVPRVSAGIGQVAGVVPVYVAFAVVMAGAGWLTGRVAGLDAPAGRAVLFSGVTRNSLVVLPLALALPAGFTITPVVVVTQTVVELVVLLVLVRLLRIRAPARSCRGCGGAPAR